MIEFPLLILFGTILALLVFIGYSYTSNAKERSKLINALIAKTSYELAQTDAADKIKVEIPTIQKEDSSERTMSDDEFREMIAQSQ